jgi:uncharacterized membrane protein/secreted protein with Ig-like and vWFA domain
MIRFARPEAFLLAVPLLLWWRGRLGPRGFIAALRLGVLFFLLGVLAEPWLPGAESGRDLVFVVDRSLSVEAAHDRTVRETMTAAADAARAGDRAGVVLFGRDAAVETPPTPAFRPGAFVKQVDRDGSDLARAMETALASIAPGRRGSLVVLSDGEATGRPAADVARAAARRGIRVDVYPLRRSGVADLAVEELALPGETDEREAFQWSAWIRSDRAREARVKLLRDGVVRGEQTRALKPGLNRIVFRDRLAEPGLHRYEVEVAGEDDRIPENNRAFGVVRASGRPRVLVVTPEGREDRLTRTLRDGGFDVAVSAPEAAPLRPEDLDSFRATILEDVPAARLPRGAQRALRSYVEDFGGGLLMTGGRAAFGAGGYRRGDVEAVLPVTMEVRQEQRKFALAMSIPLDRSGSMAAPAGGSLVKMDLANQGATAAAERLGPQDSLSVIAVDSSPHVVVPQSPVDDFAEIADRIRRIESEGGGIFVGEALHAAADQLADAPQRNKHVILFADAADAEEPGDYRTFVPSLVKSGVTVSVIGLGSEADSDAALLKEIATLGGGRCFFVAEPSELPRVFAEETMQVARATFQEEPTALSARPGLRALGDLALGAGPTLGGYAVAYARPEATVAYVTQDDQAAPALSFRQAGLGRTAAFLGQVDGPYTGDLGTWPGTGPLLNTLTRWLGGSDASGELFADLVRDGHEAVLSVEAEAGREALLGAVTAKIAGPDGVVREAVLTRTAEGRLEARFPLLGAGVYRAAVDTGDGRALRVAPVALPYSPEYATPADPGSGERLLAELAATADGRVEPPPTELFAGERESTGFVDLGVLFALSAALLLVAEVAVRRLEIPFPRPRLPRALARAIERRAERRRRARPEAATATSGAREARSARREADGEGGNDAPPRGAGPIDPAAGPAGEPGVGPAPSPPPGGGLGDALQRAKERAGRGRR